MIFLKTGSELDLPVYVSEIMYAGKNECQVQGNLKYDHISMMQGNEQ